MKIIFITFSLNLNDHQRENALICMETGLEINYFVYENSGSKGLRINDVDLFVKILHLVMERFINKNCYYFFFQV